MKSAPFMATASGGVTSCKNTFCPKKVDKCTHNSRPRSFFGGKGFKISKRKHDAYLLLFQIQIFKIAFHAKMFLITIANAYKLDS